MEKDKQWNKYLTELVNFSVDIDTLNKNLANVDWDYEPVTDIYLKISDIQSVLKKYRKNEISTKDLVDWANLLEGRESLAYLEEEADIINDLLFYLANPEINYSIDESIIEKILVNKIH
jgi:GTP1/Obg family GTP-binding protein